jgi:energy-coupling factor transporter ATP-binding protein EcfA2
LTLEDVLVYLLGPIMGFVLRQRGMTSLHASAVAVNHRAIALVGPPGAGKSTTAAAFAGLGYPVISDDIVPLLDSGNGFAVQPGYPCVCLWPDSVKSLYGSFNALPLLTPNWEKRYLQLGDERNHFHRDPLPLAAVYILGDRGTEPTRPSVEPLPVAKALIALISNTYMNYLLDSALRAHEFDFLGRLVRTVPIRQIHLHADPDYLTKNCETIVADLRGLGSSGDAARAVWQDQHA